MNVRTGSCPVYVLSSGVWFAAATCVVLLSALTCISTVALDVILLAGVSLALFLSFISLLELRLPSVYLKLFGHGRN